MKFGFVLALLALFATVDGALAFGRKDPPKGDTHERVRHEAPGVGGGHVPGVRGQADEFKGGSAIDVLTEK